MDGNFVSQIQNSCHDLVFSYWRLPMYSEAKVAFFIYLWYPKTRVCHLLSSECTICCLGYISLVQTSKWIMTGNGLCLWNLLSAIHFEAWDGDWSYFAWAENTGWGHGCSLFTEDCKLWPDKIFWNLTVCGFTIAITAIKTSSSSGTCSR